MKRCSKCLMEKPLSDFSFIQQRQQHFAWCRDCKSIDLRQWREKNPRPLTVEPVVYRITNQVNGKVYVGVTHRPFALRKAAHVAKSRSGSRFPIHAAMRKYGVNNFTFEVIEHVVDLPSLEAAEQRQIAQHNCMVPNGYNRTEGGGGMCGLQQSSESIEKRLATIASRGGYVASEDTRRKISVANRGRKMPRDGVERSREKRLGAKRTPEQIALMSRNRIGKGLGNQGARKYPGAVIRYAFDLLEVGRTQSEISKMTGLTQPYISNLATGKRGSSFRSAP